jgi:hypothetical protein
VKVMAEMKRDEIDRVLDAALAKYAAAQPRQGLEERVLANLRSERARVPYQAWWHWSVMALTAAIVIVAITFAWRSGERPHPLVADHLPIRTPSMEQPVPWAATKTGANNVHPQASSPAIRQATHRARHKVVEPADPKLDQFPSRQQLSEQELALARYVSEFPQEATLIARAQEEYEKEIQEKMKDAHSETEFSNSDQQER